MPKQLSTYALKNTLKIQKHVEVVMSVDRKIQNLLNTINYKITDIQTRLDALDANSEVDQLMPTILSTVEGLGCCPPKYCLPELCVGELPEILDIPLPPSENVG